MLGRTETRTRDRMYCQMIRTVREIFRDNRARIATCSLQTLTDRLKENYSIDESIWGCVDMLIFSGYINVTVWLGFISIWPYLGGLYECENN